MKVHERTIESDLMALICKDGLLSTERQLKLIVPGYELLRLEVRTHWKTKEVCKNSVHRGPQGRFQVALSRCSRLRLTRQGTPRKTLTTSEVMSATVEADHFKSYFSQPLDVKQPKLVIPPTQIANVDVPVFTHQKFVFYLDDLRNEAQRIAVLRSARAGTGHLWFSKSRKTKLLS